jgi:FtsP/CotA-like multicopper oxidase with cupredoxin domain
VRRPWSCRARQIGLPEARKTELVELADRDEFELEIIPVKKRIGDVTVRMLAYNGSVPGPTLKVLQGATVTVRTRASISSGRQWSRRA